MKSSILVGLKLLVSITLFGQQNTNSEVSCFQIAKDLSYYWKLDSLGNNGLRLYTCERFVTCSNKEKIYADVLLTLLGKPNDIWRTNKGVEYIYYCYDSRTMPKAHKGPLACMYVSFKFESDKNHLTSVETGDIDP